MISQLFRTALFVWLPCCLVLRVDAQDISLSRPGSLLFTENKGQITDRNGNLQNQIRFTTGTGNVHLFLADNGISYQFNIAAQHGSADPRDLTRPVHRIIDRFDMRLIGANPKPAIHATDPSGYYENFYLAHCPEGITG